MKYNPLGRTGMTVSEICLGTMTWGSQNTEAEAHQQLDYALEHGVNFIDTAELYPTTPLSKDTYGDTERFIGTWHTARGNRDKVIIATKVAGPGRDYIRGGAPTSRAGILEAVDGSLKRLQTTSTSFTGRTAGTIISATPGPTARGNRTARRSRRISPKSSKRWVNSKRPARSAPSGFPTRRPGARCSS